MVKNTKIGKLNLLVFTIKLWQNVKLEDILKGLGVNKKKIHRETRKTKVQRLPLPLEIYMYSSSRRQVWYGKVRKVCKQVIFISGSGTHKTECVLLQAKGLNIKLRFLYGI